MVGAGGLAGGVGWGTGAEARCAARAVAGTSPTPREGGGARPGRRANEVSGRAGTPTRSPSPSSRPQGTCSLTALASGASSSAPGALNQASTPRGRSGALSPPGTAPRGGPPGLPGGPEVPRGLPGCLCVPGSPGPRPAACP